MSTVSGITTGRPNNKKAKTMKLLQGTAITTARVTPPVIEFDGTEDTLKLFVKLTSFTCPHGFEVEMYGDSLAKRGWKKDRHGNFSYIIPNLDGTASRTMFTSHTDTASHAVPIRVHHSWTEDGLLVNDGGDILGADDKAGMTVLLRMAHLYQIPGQYHLFVGEERGCVGSRQASLDNSWKHIDRVISFDRRGTNSIITNQAGEECCSDTFAYELAARLNGLGGFQFAPDPTGLYTDSYSFIEDVPECTNISVGYEGAHGSSESQDIEFLDNLIAACANIDWETLPTQRDPKPLWPMNYKEQVGTYWTGNNDTEWSGNTYRGNTSSSVAEDVLSDMWEQEGLSLEALRSFAKKYPHYTAALMYVAVTNHPEVVYLATDALR
jgi:hypothetical protein